MRVLLSIHHRLNPDLGAPGVTFQLANIYNKLGISADLLSYSDLPHAFPERCAQFVYPCFAAYSLATSKVPYDVVDLSSGDGWIYHSLRPKGRTLLVTRSHGLEHVAHLVRLAEAKAGRLRLSPQYGLYHGGFRLWEVARSFRTADLALFLNGTDLSFAVERLGVDPKRARVTSNGISNAFVGLDLNPQKRKDGGNFKLALIGSYIHRKLNVAPTALNRLLGKHPHLEIGFLGAGKPPVDILHDYRPEYHRRIKVVERYQNDSLPALLSEYSALLFPSLSEGFGLGIYEAMACGLAVVATRLPTLEERLCDGDNVLFVPVNDAEAIEASIDRLITDPALLLHLQVSGHAKAQEFAWPRVARDTLALYEEFLSWKLSTRES
jgi:glycosyltransferase involved in cell wall biosynthesis